MEEKEVNVNNPEPDDEPRLKRPKPEREPKIKTEITWKKIVRQRELILMSIPLTLYMIFFRYYPLTGWSMAFQNYKPAIRNVWDQEWVGFAQFTKLLDYRTLFGENFWRAVRNTFGQSILSMVLGYIFAITLSLLLNEVRQIGVKRVIQNISYLPHFLSWIIATGMIASALASPAGGGIVNILLDKFGLVSSPVPFLSDPKYFWWIVAFGNLWKSLGWNTIIYLAAMTAIDPALYESAEIDGANRYQKMWHITLPSIKATIVILIIMSTGTLLESGFELQYFLGYSVTKPTAENIDIYVLNYGITKGNYSLATVAGMMKTLVSFIFVFTANWIAGLLGEDRLI
jgi:putative aldouronate transport system permease protein